MLKKWCEREGVRVEKSGDGESVKDRKTRCKDEDYVVTFVADSVEWFVVRVRSMWRRIEALVDEVGGVRCALSRGDFKLLDEDVKKKPTRSSMHTRNISVFLLDEKRRRVRLVGSSSIACGPSPRRFRRLFELSPPNSSSYA